MATIKPIPEDFQGAESELSSWQTGTAKPTIEGPYLREFDEGEAISTWCEGKKRMRACDAAIQVLIETDNPSLMYGDEWLCHQIAGRLGWEHEGPATSRRVLRALAKTPGRLVKGLVRMPGDCCARGQSALHFELPMPEHDFMMGYLRQGQKPDWANFKTK